MLQCAIAVALATLLALHGAASAAQSPSTARYDVAIVDGDVVRPDPPVLRLRHNERATIRWHSDRAGEIHVHGYDLAVELPRDVAVEATLVARATGRFPVTSHGFGADKGHTHGNRPLLFIEVYPE